MTKAEPEVIQQQTPAPGTLSIIAILIGLVERQVAIYVPSGYRAGTAVPMVFALHGGGGDASKMYGPDKRIVDYAESEGFIAVFPNGLPAPGAPAGSNKYYWNDPANIGFMNHLIDLEAIRYTNPATGHTVISVLDPAIPHKWPEWNFMGAIWDFFEQAPTR
jgi:polyhydroxybutyrate depolymerase